MGVYQAGELTVRRWAENGGKVLVAEPVLDEVAYHAWIAQQDFDQVSLFLPGTEMDRLHVIDNAFVRSFAELMSRKEASIQQWRKYISMYKGKDPHDWGNVFGLISTEYSIKKLPARSTKEAGLADKVRLFLLDIAEKRSPRLDKAARDKAARDAELYAALVHHIDTLKSSDPGATCLLVSSARRLGGVEDRFHESGEQQMVISIASALYIVSLIPNVSLGLSAMKAFLFDERKSRFSSDLERTLLRMVKASRELSMPWAKRGVLMREVRDRLLQDATRRGVKVKRQDLVELEQQALSPKNQESTVEVLRNSLDAIASDRRLEKENRDLKAKVAELEAKLNRRTK